MQVSWHLADEGVTQGADRIGVYSRTARSNRKCCKSCGGILFAQHPGWGVVDVYAAVIPGFEFQPGVHCVWPGEAAATAYDAVIVSVDRLTEQFAPDLQSTFSGGVISTNLPGPRLDPGSSPHHLIGT